MEITEVETYTLGLPTGETFGDARASVTERFWVVVELDTDAGYRGTGWLSTWRAAELFESYLRDAFADLLVGRNPFETEAVREAMRERTLYYPGELGMSAHPRAAIDVALWDLKAKAAGEPLYRFLGGDEREVPAYLSRMDAGYDREELAAVHGEYAERGFRTFKTKVGNRSPEAEARRVETIREAVGPDADVAVDANQSWTVAEAVRTVRALEPRDLAWVEEPISEFDLDGHARVAERIAPPVAGGEMLYRPEQFRHLLASGGMEIAQPDLVRAGGVTGQWEVARLAAGHGVPFIPHIYYAVSAHLVSAAPNGRMVEYIPEYDVGGVVENAPRIEDGRVRLPDEPGHGYRIDPEAKAEYLVPSKD
ncbi:mandelate racemase/muconate lactonizing enzyme family protein [Halegenticoccus soli]|uniref:mandelate racemase/muconate lactonizing enzyme family protein n=1 Tax=Halegenticoccus soli TaxID=1985678 RepID=UPI000C6D7462|nr:mandelate racemase/muconate lactonizing enzyme family protein [Halegenticoccus soli]